VGAFESVEGLALSDLFGAVLDGVFCVVVQG